MAPSPCRMSCRKNSPVTRLPMKRPCWSGKTMRTVSIEPSVICLSIPSASSRPLSMVAPSADASGATDLPRPPRPNLGAGSLLDALQVPLDRRELFGRALDFWPLEPLPRRDRVPPAGADQDNSHRDRRVVEVRPLVHRGELGEHEEDGDEPDPNHRDPPDHVAPSPEMPGSPLEAFPGSQSEEHGNRVCDVETDDRDRRHCVIGDGAPQVGHPQK